MKILNRQIPIRGTIKKTQEIARKNIIKSTAPLIYNVCNILPNGFSQKLMGFLDKFMPKKQHYIQKLSDSFYCGSEIGGKEVENIAQRGIKVVVDLKVQSKKNIQNLMNLCKKNEVLYQNIPINIFGKPAASMEQIINVIKKATKENPVYVHCKYGEDRTGFVRGLYLLLKEKKEMPEVLSELKKNGYKFEILKQFTKKLHEMSNFCL